MTNQLIRIRIKKECCPWCAGELVVEDGKLTCIDNCGCHNDELEYHSETMAKVQPVIDWVTALDSQE